MGALESALWVCLGSIQSAYRRVSMFSFTRKALLRCCVWHELAGRNEVCVAPVYGHQIRHHSGNRDYCAIGIPSPPLALIEQGQFFAVSSCDSSGLDRDVLDMLVALLGERCTHNLVSRAPFLSAQSTIA